jgi:hypothetical protein
MPLMRFRLDVLSTSDDDEILLDRLTEELAEDLRDLGDVHPVEAQGGPAPDAKGAAEIVVGSLALVAGTDPAIVQSLVELTLGFLRRNEGRRVHLRVADIELTIDRPSRAETAELIRTLQATIERSER